MSAFADALADLTGDPSIGVAGWWVPRSGPPAPLWIVVKVPALGELDNRAPKSVRQRLLDLPAGAGAGDLVAWDGCTWLLGGAGDPDPLGLTRRWIATELQQPVSYDVDGRPLLTWDGMNFT